MTEIPQTIRTNLKVWQNRKVVQNESYLRDALHRLEVGRVDIDSLYQHCNKEKTIRLSIEGIHYSGKSIVEEISTISDRLNIDIRDTINILLTEIVTNNHIYNVEIPIEQ